MTARKPRKPIRIWVAVDADGTACPWSSDYTRKECRRNLREWLWLSPASDDEDYIKAFSIRRATLTLDPPRRKGGRT